MSRMLHTTSSPSLLVTRPPRGTNARRFVLTCWVELEGLSKSPLISVAAELPLVGGGRSLDAVRPPREPLESVLRDDRDMDCLTVILCPRTLIPEVWVLFEPMCIAGCIDSDMLASFDACGLAVLERWIISPTTMPVVFEFVAAFIVDPTRDD